MAEQTATDSRDLMARAQTGEADAFAELYSRYQPAVFGFMWRRTGNRQLAEDLTQDVFVRALRSIGKWQWQGKDVLAWLNTISRNLLFDHRNRAATRLEISVADFTGRPDTDRPAQVDLEAEVIAKLRGSQALKALWQIKESQRTCLINRYVIGMSISETAAAMGSNEGAIKSLTSRAVQALAKVLGPQVGGDASC